MKIIFVNRYFFPDGSPTSVLLGDVAFDAAASGCEVHVVTSRQRYDQPRAGLKPAETHAGVLVHRVWTSRFGRHSLPGRLIDYVTFYLCAASCLWTLARKGDIVVAKTDPPLIGVVAYAVARFRGALLINWLQDLYPEIAVALGVKGIRGPLEAVFKCLRNASLRGARLNVAVDEEMAKRIIWQGVPENKVLVIPNWADGAVVRPMPREENHLRKEWGMNGKFIVGYTGNFGRVYDFDTVLDAAARLKGYADIVFLFVGEGPQKSSVQTKCRRLGLEGAIFKPMQPQARLGEVVGVPDVHLISLRAAANGCVMPSKLYAAMAAGRPVVFCGQPSGSADQIITEGDFGFSVTTGDGGAVADRILKLKEFADLRARMGINARSAFERGFDKPLGLEKWRRAFRGLGGGGP